MPRIVLLPKKPGSQKNYKPKAKDPANAIREIFHRKKERRPQSRTPPLGLVS
jgi:hypothetical protein